MENLDETDLASDSSDEGSAELIETEAETKKPEKVKPKGPAFSKSVVDDVPVTLNAFLGNNEMTVSDLMALEEGAVIALESTLNDLAELRLNDRVIARGEVVAVGDNFGIRITEIND